MAFGDVYWSSPRHVVRFGAGGALLDIRRPSQWDGTSHFGFDRYWNPSACSPVDGQVYSLAEYNPPPPDYVDSWGEIYADDLTFVGLWGAGAAGPNVQSSISFSDADIAPDHRDGTFWVLGGAGGFYDADQVDDSWNWNTHHVRSDGTVISHHALLGPGWNLDTGALPKNGTKLYFSDNSDTIYVCDLSNMTTSVFAVLPGSFPRVKALAAASNGNVFAWNNRIDGVDVFDASGTHVDVYSYDNGDWNGATSPGGTDVRIALDSDESHLLIGANGEFDSIWRISLATREGNQDPWVTLGGVMDSAGFPVDYGDTTGLWPGYDPLPPPYVPPNRATAPSFAQVELHLPSGRGSPRQRVVVRSGSIIQMTPREGG